MSCRIGFPVTYRCLFFASILALTHVHTLADPPYKNCSTSPGNFTDIKYQNQRNDLLSILSSNASNSRFYSTNVGDNVDDQLYGNFLCFGNLPLTECQECVTLAAGNIKKLCPMSKQAIGWEEKCLLRYSNKPYFGTMDDTTTNLPLWNNRSVSDPELFTDAVKKLMSNLTETAAYHSAANLLSTGHSSFEDLHGLAQCTADLSPSNCNSCLQFALNQILSCCSSFRGARVYSKSCYLRYELYVFPGIDSDNPPPSKKSRRNVLVAVFVAIPVVGLIVIMAICLYCSVSRKTKHQALSRCTTPAGTSRETEFVYNTLEQDHQMKPREFPLISFLDILTATNNFSESNKLGQGGFGAVYKGKLPDGQEVAIKRLSSDSEQGSDEFMNEISLIMKLQHKNLVRLLGCCIEHEEWILVYEYMQNGGLDAFLAPSRRIHLDWRKRVNIIMGVAKGLLYLHQDSRHRIIHRDLKASNVLLDHDLNPKISDFGMAKIFQGNLGEANTARIVGTYGYMAPEYAMEGLYSIKSDVYGFGVLLLEILTGKKNSGFHLTRLAPSLIAYVGFLLSFSFTHKLVTCKKDVMFKPKSVCAGMAVLD
ncbi:hypothetical protein MKW92_003209 [Papaver armeniacum]|nr:hypothetical protein MKW92_003209 [Papaver armeniacum]